jgi:molecular chaperone GrpE
MGENAVENNQGDQNQKKAIPIEVKHVRPVEEEPVRVTDKRFWVKEEEAETKPGENEAVVSPSLKPAYVEELEKQLADSQKKLEEVIAAHRQFKAELQEETQKTRQRIQNDFNRRLSQSSAEMAKRFLPVLENLDRALASSEENRNSDQLLEGIKLIRAQFDGALKNLGIEEIPVLGEIFNPELAEAVDLMPVAEEKQENRVMEVVSRGYRLNEILVRPAKVRVGRFTAQS